MGELHGDEKGLSREEAKNRLQQYGLNEIKEKEAEPLWKIIAHQFTDPLVVILIAAAVLTTFIGHYVDTWVILAVVVLNGTIGFVQENKADKAMQALKNLAAPKATVAREGAEERIDARELVPGDVVVLSAGNRVPADVRLFALVEFQVDESMLTGESMPVSKKIEPIEADYLPLAEWKNMAFMGSVITHGRARGIVVSTGEKTELGKISEQVQETVKVKTPLQKKLIHFTRIIGAASLGLSLLVVLIGLYKGIEFIALLLFAISMSVAVIPEGLPIVITITMSVGLKRMAEKNAIIRKLVAVETLGSCNYICSDKTGTITENRMTVTCAYAKGKIFTFTGAGYDPQGKVLDGDREAGQDEGLKQLLLTGVLCNTAKLYFDEKKKTWKINGMPTEGALIVAARKFGIEESVREYELAGEVPFNSSRKYMAMLYRHGGNQELYVKGAPERILSFAGLKDDAELLRQYTAMAQEGMRVLAFARKDVCRECIVQRDLEQEATQGVSFVGFQGIIDPPRQSVIEAVQGTREAGINVVMITGDNKVTAAAIARQVGVDGGQADEKAQDHEDAAGQKEAEEDGEARKEGALGELTVSAEEKDVPDVTAQSA